jgi:hypothetical protein
MNDVIKGMKDKVAKGIVLQMVKESPVLQKINFETTDSYVNKSWQSKSVTDAVWRDIGTTFSETKDIFDELVEGIYLMGGMIDIDEALKRPGQKEIDVYAENLLLQSKRFNYGFMETFINGDRAVDPKTFNGLKVRVEAVGGNQVIAGGSLSLVASSANRQTFLDIIRRSFFDCGTEGKPDLIITSRKGYLALTSVARREGLLDVGKDNFDRAIDTFDGVALVWAGTKGDQVTEIIPSDAETAAGARIGGTDTSYYVVKFGYPYIQGLQMAPPKRIFDDICDDGVTHRVVFEWPVGLSVMNTRAIVRIRGITANVG